MTFDVIVIGAGMSGMTAARAVSEAGKRALVLEASGRVGGRIWSALSARGEPIVELGAEFVHGNPKPSLELASEAGAPLQGVADRHFERHGNGFEELTELWQTFSQIVNLGKPNEIDTTAQSFLEQHGIDGERAERFRQLVEGFEAAALAEVSIQSLAADSQALSEDDSQYRVQGGYARLLDFTRDRALAAGAELRLNSPVKRVEWQPNGPTTVAGPGLRAQACICIVTVSVAVLQLEPNAGGIAFMPELGPWRGAIARVGMGHACRVSFSFGRNFARTAAPRDVFLHQPRSMFETFWSTETEQSVLWTAWAGGPKARTLSMKDNAQRQKLALEALALLLGLPGTTLSAHLEAVHHHDFSNDPHVLGAYSFCRPEGTSASQSLRVPIGGTLVLGGEVTDHEYPGTVAGAIASGKRAGKQALELLSLRGR